MTPKTFFNYALSTVIGFWLLIMVMYITAIWIESGKLAATASVLLVPAILGTIFTGIYYEDEVT